MTKPILCVDFDGVIHSYTSPWAGADQVLDPPVPGALRWLWKATEWFDVQIYSSRSSQPDGIAAMKDWFVDRLFEEWGDDEFVITSFMASLSFPKDKPAAFLTIDDRAVTFEGDWSELDPCELLQFKPWNKRQPKAIELGAAVRRLGLQGA